MGNKLWVEISWYSSFKQKIFVRMYNRCVVIDQNLMYSKREKGQENSVYGYERSPCIAWSSRRLLRFLLIPWGLLYIQQRKRRVRKVWKVWRGYMYNKGQIPTLDRFPVLRRGWFEINKLMKLHTWKVNILQEPTGTVQSAMYLKGSVSRDFRPPFFHDSNASGPLINSVKYFRIWFRFRIMKKMEVENLFNGEIKCRSLQILSENIVEWV